MAIPGSSREWPNPFRLAAFALLAIAPIFISAYWVLVKTSDDNLVPLKYCTPMTIIGQGSTEEEAKADADGQFEKRMSQHVPQEGYTVDDILTRTEWDGNQYKIVYSILLRAKSIPANNTMTRPEPPPELSVQE